MAEPLKLLETLEVQRVREIGRQKEDLRCRACVAKKRLELAYKVFAKYRLLHDRLRVTYEELDREQALMDGRRKIVKLEPKKLTKKEQKKADKKINTLLDAMTDEQKALLAKMLQEA